ncbi:uncharacterized protein LOC130725558 [Lotus japonicus]|uniref:uncharacterized protein LOC130725558 n=1 Tax=Lotus japonicus TaxID=34305 RepID=UPI00258FBF91|nr:uncharacterized protein LOC130725558 [Lotus japonicus]
MARFSPKFNAEGDGKKRGGAESQTEGAQAPKRRRLVKVSNPGAQPTAAAASKGKNAAGTCQLSTAKASAATATESATVTAPNPAPAGSATIAASKSTTIGATTATADQPSTADTTTNIAQPSATEKLAATNATTAAGINETKEETLACLLRAGCIFAHAFDNFNAVAAETERLKAESAQHQEAVVAWKKRFDKLLEQAGKEKVQADKLIGAAGIKIGELEDHLKLMKEEADDLDASLQACKKQKDQIEKDLVAKGEALGTKESELEILGAELESAKKALAEQEKKCAESLASAKADLEAAMRATSEEIKKADEAHGAALAAKDAEITSHLARIKELEGELAVEKAKATEIAKSMFNAYLNGAYHCLAESDNVEFVLCFHMSDDVFWKMNLPQVISQEENNKFYIRHSNIVVLNDRVGYVREYMRSEFRFEIWMMNEYGVEGSWVRMFNLARGPCPEILLEFWNKDDEDIFVLGGDEYQPLVLHKIGKQEVKV